MTTLASVVLGALLALAGGIWTERWKQRKEARAAARLVWLELMIDYSTLQGAVALEEWPAKFTFSEDAWMAQRDRLALVRSSRNFKPPTSFSAQLRKLRPASVLIQCSTGLLWCLWTGPFGHLARPLVWSGRSSTSSRHRFKIVWQRPAGVSTRYARTLGAGKGTSPMMRC